MIDFTVYNTVTGEITYIGSCQIDEINNQGGIGFSVVEGHYSPSEYYFSNNIPIKKPELSENDVDWDEINKIWKFNKQAAKQKLKNKVEDERIKRDKKDIVYDSKNIQADDEARANIHGKLAEIVAAQALGITTSPLIWRDSDNITHTWTDMIEYKLWLQGLVMIIAARGTALYQSMWTHKANISALNTKEEIKNYDTTIGW